MNPMSPYINHRAETQSVNLKLGLITLTALTSLALGGSALAGVGALASLKGFAPFLLGGGGVVSGVSFPLWFPSQRRPTEKALVFTREYTQDELSEDFGTQINTYQLDHLEPGYLEMHLVENNTLVKVVALKRKEPDPWRFVLNPSETDDANLRALRLQSRYMDHILAETRGFFDVDDADFFS